MGGLDYIFTNRVLRDMRKLGLSESLVLSIFNSGEVEKSKIGGFNVVKKFPGYEIGVYYIRDKEGRYKIVTVWKRDRR